MADMWLVKCLNKKKTPLEAAQPGESEEKNIWSDLIIINGQNIVNISLWFRYYFRPAADGPLSVSFLFCLFLSGNQSDR